MKPVFQIGQLRETRSRYPTTLVVMVPAFAFAAACQQGTDRVTHHAAPLQLVYRATDESTDVSFPYWAMMRADGSMIVSKLEIPNLPGIIDRNGRVVRVLGQRGSGPGEFTAPSVGTLKGDSIIISDFNTGVMLFDPQGSFVRHMGVRAMGAQQLLLLRGDTLLLAQSISTRASAGLPFHLKADRDRVVRSFGADDRTVERGFSYKNERAVVAESDSTFWSAQLGRYLLERWHINGARLGSIELKRAWFPPMTRNPGRIRVERPSTRITSLEFDEHGHLLVLILRARPDWRPTETTRSRIEPARGLVLVEQLQHIEQLIEVVDTSSGSLVATINGPEGYLLQLLRDGKVMGLTAGPDDRQFTTVWAARH